MCNELDETDLRAALFVTCDYLRRRLSAPPSLHRLRVKLDSLIRNPSPSGQESVVRQPQWISTNDAAQILDWHPRRVRRHAADLGGELIGQRLLFDAAEVRDYAKGLEHGRDTD